MTILNGTNTSFISRAHMVVELEDFLSNSMSHIELYYKSVHKSIFIYPAEQVSYVLLQLIFSISLSKLWSDSEK